MTEKILDSRFSALLKALARSKRFAPVLETYHQAQAASKKGFGSDALKVNGKIFAMASSRGEFVVKLSKDRVAALVKGKQGVYFEAGKGKPMKEWLVVAPGGDSLGLAKEAHDFVAAQA